MMLMGFNDFRFALNVFYLFALSLKFEKATTPSRLAKWLSNDEASPGSAAASTPGRARKAATRSRGRSTGAGSRVGAASPRSVRSVHPWSASPRSASPRPAAEERETRAADSAQAPDHAQERIDSEACSVSV